MGTDGEGVTSLVLDFSKLEYISSSGLRIFLSIRKAAAAKGYCLHANREHCLATAESLLANKERYGYMCCPCRLACEDAKADRDIICPCTYRDADIAEYGA